MSKRLRIESRWHHVLLSAIIVSLSGTLMAEDCPQLPPLFADPHVTQGQVQTLLTDVRKQPHMTCAPFDLHTVKCTSEADPVVFIFTMPGHPAHPAVSRGAVLWNGSTACIVRDGYFAGDEMAFRGWISNLKKYDESVVNQFRSRH